MPERLSTILTRIRPLPRVDELVRPEVLTRSKALSTIGARVRFEADMAAEGLGARVARLAGLAKVTALGGLPGGF